ncbi:hypothetical protein U1Q18_025765 [Sarracenia purpurea var. burkii]
MKENVFFPKATCASSWPMGRVTVVDERRGDCDFAMSYDSSLEVVEFLGRVLVGWLSSGADKSLALLSLKDGQKNRRQVSCLVIGLLGTLPLFGLVGPVKYKFLSRSKCWVRVLYYPHTCGMNWSLRPLVISSVALWKWTEKLWRGAI